MQNGLLNPSLKNSGDLLFKIIHAVVGDPIVANENLRFTIPAAPVDRDMDNLFHKMVLSGFFTKLGYSAKPINEALCVVFDCNPIMKGEEGGDVPFTGIGMSFGAGMANIVLAFKGMGLVEFSCTKSGDNIDEQSEKVTGVPKSKIVKIKEKKLNLNNVDNNDRVQTALSIYYDETIERIIHYVENKFKDTGSEINGEVEIVVSGGTSMVPGFDKRLEEAIKKSDLPFKIYKVRMAKSPFFSVSNGACLRAQSDYAKQQKK
jgi:hypothetical protein